MVDWGLLATHMGWLSVSLDAVHVSSTSQPQSANAAPFCIGRGYRFWMVFGMCLVCVCGSCHVVYQSLSEFILFVGQKSWPVSPIHFHHGWIHTPQVKSRLSHNRFHHVSPWHGIIGSFTVNSLQLWFVSSDFATNMCRGFTLSTHILGCRDLDKFTPW